MNKRYFIAVLGVIILTLVGVWFYISRSTSLPADQVTGKEAEIRALVAEFGSKLNMVSILAPKDIAAKAIEESYGQFVSPEVLVEWRGNPALAPGRTTSNPHPDRIEILLVEQEGDGSYTVQAKVIEVATGSPEPVNEYPISLKLRNVEGRWIITGFVKAILRPQ